MRLIVNLLSGLAFVWMGVVILYGALLTEPTGAADWIVGTLCILGGVICVAGGSGE